MRLLGLLVVLSFPILGGDELFVAIRNGDVRAVKRAGGVDAPGPEGLTPLVYAVMTAGVPVMRAVLDAGANVNAATADGITALHVAAYDLEKTRLLVSRGADVNATSKRGATPLLMAADRPGGLEIVRLLVEKGAKVDSVAGGGSMVGPTALSRAAGNGDVAVMRYLLAHGAKVENAQGIARFAAFGHCAECLRIALEAGAPADHTDKPARTALQDAAAFGSIEMVRVLVEKGAAVSKADPRGYTALMRAALSYEPGAGEVIAYLLEKGADPKPKNETGDTALSLALRFGETPAVALLRKAGAPEPKTAVRVPPALETNSVAAAVERSLPLLQKIAAPVRKLNQCTTCHNHTLPAMAVAMAKARGVPVDEQGFQTDMELARTPNSGSMVPILLGTGVPDFFPYQLMGLAVGGGAPGVTIDGMVHHVTTRQDATGRFKGFDYRPPQEYTDITFTATALRAMQLHPIPGRAAELKERTRRAARWLAAQRPRDTEEHALRLMGLAWAGPGGSVREAAVRGLTALQRADGGWGQTAALASDAYATGETLYALHLAGVPANDAAYRRGVAYLLGTQRKDGSWYVTSRSHPVQPLIDGGYPYINHQWISASAGAWSTMALLAAVPAQSAAK